MKYAAAISPEQMNAATRVSRPIMMRMPPTSSITPATQGNDPVGITVPPNMPINFCRPWNRNRNPATIRNRAYTCGA